MQPTVLTTKLFVPSPRPTEVVRPALVKRLQAGRHGKLTLVSAPAGFGKTTLISQWIHQSGLDVAWYSLDAGDQDPTRFLIYLIAALQTIRPHVGAGLLDALQTGQSVSPESVLTALINDLAATQDHMLLVLDDYHVLDAEPIDALVAFLLEYLPPQLHLVITTREDPPFSLVRLRARGELTELRIADLRFAEADAQAFLNQQMGLTLSAEEVSLLDERTDGWIAGLQMAAISLRDQPDIARFLQEFSGSHRYILDYLAEEVLRQQPQPIQKFLLQTSILDRLTASLCDAVTGLANTQTILETLERGNMLIFPLDAQRQWYRFHHLFAEVLQAFALRDMPDQIAEWRHRASVWYEDHGFRAAAIDYAFAAKNTYRAADLIERTWPEMFYGVRPMTWLAWAQRLPPDMIRARPVLSAACAWMLLDKGELHAAEQHIGYVEQWLQQSADEAGQQSTLVAGMIVANTEEFRTLPGSTYGARAYLAQLRGDMPATIAHARRSLELLSDTDHFWRGNTALFLGLAQFAIGDLAAAYESITVSVASQRLSNSHYFEMLGMVILGDIQMAQGRLHGAHQHYQQVLQLASAAVEGDHQQPPSQHTPLIQAPIALYVGLSELHLAWDDLATAAQYLQAGQILLDQAILPASGYRLLCADAYLKAIQGDFDGALATLNQAAARYQPAAVPDTVTIEGLRVRIWLRQGNLLDATAWAEQQSRSLDDLDFAREFNLITLASVLIAEYRNTQAVHRIEDAAALLDHLLPLAETGGRVGRVIEILSLQALAQHAQGALSEARTTIKHALTLAQPEGYIRLFADMGQPMRELLSASLADGADAAYVLRILQAIDAPSPDAVSTADANQLLIEPLSDRELDVLQLMADGYTNQAIADALFIALSTVKKHVNNILGKLGVTNRTQAINRARELNILS